MRELYVVYFESANYAGYGEHALVWASSVEEALADEQLAQHAEEFYYEQDGDQYLEEHGDDDGVVWAYIGSALPLKGSEFEQYVAKQPQLYPVVNQE